MFNNNTSEIPSPPPIPSQSRGVGTLPADQTPLSLPPFPRLLLQLFPLQSLPPRTPLIIIITIFQADNHIGLQSFLFIYLSLITIMIVHSK